MGGSLVALFILIVSVGVSVYFIARKENTSPIVFILLFCLVVGSFFSIFNTKIQVLKNENGVVELKK